MIRNPMLSIIHMMLSSGQCERGPFVSGVPGMRDQALFDEKKFRGYGPYGYDVKELIAREQAARRGSCAKLPEGCERN